MVKEQKEWTFLSVINIGNSRAPFSRARAFKNVFLILIISMESLVVLLTFGNILCMCISKLQSVLRRLSEDVSSALSTFTHIKYAFRQLKLHIHTFTER